jgi:VWFA-related protein
MFCAVRWPGLTSTWVINYDLHPPAATRFRAYFLAVAWLAASLTGAAAQENGATFRSKVNVVQVPVVVRDTSGRAVGNLTQGDFELFDKGKRQVITSFSRVRHVVVASTSQPYEAAATGTTHGAEAAAANVPADRHIIYVFDDLNVSFNDMAAVRAAALQQFKNSLPARDWAAVHTFSGRASLPFTNDHTKLEEAVTKLRQRPSMGHNVSACPDVSYYLANLIINVEDQRALDAATKQTIECAHVKTLPAQFIAKTAARKELAFGDQDVYTALETVKNAVRQLAGIPGERLVILASPGFFAQTPNGKRGMTGILDLATRNSVIISSLDLRGVISLHQMDASNERQRSALEMEYYGQRERANSDVLVELADSTGGGYFSNNNDLKAGFGRLTEAPESSYVLGFTPTSLKTDGSFHALKIRVAGRTGLTLQARRGYYALTPESPEEMARTEMHDVVFSREERKDLPMRFTLLTSKSHLTVVTKLDPKGLHFEKIDGRSCDSLSIVAALFDTEGGYVAGVTKIVNLKLSDATLAQVGAGIDVPADFAVKPGIYMARVVVRETKGGATSAQNGAVPVP